MTVGWSPEKKLWNELVRIGASLSWKRVDLDSSRSHRIPEKDTGVYLICASAPSEAVKTLNACTVLYAGQVKSSRRGLRTRFLEHIKKPTARLKSFLDCYYPKVHFWFACVREPAEIDELEGLLIGVFNPPCNEIGAPGTSVLTARLGIPKPIGFRTKHHSA